MEEQLAVLRMVAAGSVSPEEALDLLDALGADAAGGANASVPLRVHFALGGGESDFTLPASSGARLGDVLREILAVLPAAARPYVPEGLLHSALMVGEAPEDRLVRLQDCDFELKVTRQRFHFGFGRGLAQDG